MFGRKKINHIISELDLFINKMDECVLIYKNGIKNYLEGNSQAFVDNIQSVTAIREDSTELRRSIENSLYSYTLVSENRVDILQLMEHIDMIIGQLYKNLVQYEIEIPFFPSELNIEFLKLVELVSLSVEITAQAMRDYFRSPQQLPEKIHRIYYYEKEAGKLAQAIKRKVFHEMENFKLSQKIHLRYFTLHVEQIAEETMKAADLLAILTIKQRF